MGLVYDRKYIHMKVHLKLECCARSFVQTDRNCPIFNAVLNYTLLPTESLTDLTSVFVITTSVEFESFTAN